MSDCGARPISRRIPSTSARKSGCWTWSADTLTLRLRRRSSGSDSLSALTWRPASLITRRPRGRIVPVSSASAMKSSGGTRPRDGRRVTEVRHVVEEDRELVAAEAGRQVPLADAAPDPLGDRDEERVARGVTHRVVDDLEIVEVEEEDDRQRPVVAHAP